MSVRSGTETRNKIIIIYIIMKELTNYLKDRKLRDIPVPSIRESKEKSHSQRKIEQYGKPRVFNLFRAISLNPDILK